MQENVTLYIDENGHFKPIKEADLQTLEDEIYFLAPFFWPDMDRGFRRVKRSEVNENDNSNIGKE